MKAVFGISGWWMPLCEDCLQRLILRPQEKEVGEAVCSQCGKHEPAVN